MPKVELLEKDLVEISRAYGEVHGIKQGKVAFTKLVEPKGFVLQAKNQQLRFYLYQKAKAITWEHIWGFTSIIHEGLPITEGLLQYNMKQAFKAGKQAADDPIAFAAALLKDLADEGSHVHNAMEDLLQNKPVTIAGRTSTEQWYIMSGANFINDHQIRNWRCESKVVYDKTLHKMRMVYGGIVDLICEIYNPDNGKWEWWLIDYKTSKEAHLSHRVQAMAYRAAAIQSLGIPIKHTGILLLGKKTVKGYQLVEIGNERRKITFQDVVMVYRMALLMNGGKLPGPTYKIFPTKIKLIQTPKEGVNNGSSNTNNSSGGSHPSSPALQKKKRGGPPKSKVS